MNDHPHHVATLPRRSLHLLLCLLVAATPAAAPASAAMGATPVAVSPGVTVGGGESVTGPCPTFSWTLRGGGEPELRVYELGDSGAEEPRVTLELTLPPGASSWSPSRGECLELGSRYAWTVRAAGGEWAEPALFRVERPPSREEVARAIETLRRHLGSRDDTEPESLRAAGPEVGVGPDRSDPGVGRTVETVQGAARVEEAAALRPADAPSLGSPSLTLSNNLALGSASNVFKDGVPFLWDDNSGNTALGRQALASPTGTATSNTAVGRGALQNTQAGKFSFHGSGNTAVGDGALLSNTTGSRNTAVGFEALSQSTSGANTAIGAATLKYNTTGSVNTAIGTVALLRNTTGRRNIAAGGSALKYNTTGSFNTAIGHHALYFNTEGNDNIAIGSYAGLYVSNAGQDDNILIANIGASTDSGKIRIGTVGTQDAAFIAGIHGATTGQTGGQTVLVDAEGQLGTASCGTTYVAATGCPAGNLDGPKCDRVPAGSYCEGDGECGTSSSLNNCGTFEWYLRTE